MSPGEGAFVSLPAPATLTFVGEVPQGVLSNNIPVNFSIVSMQTPQSMSLSAAGFPAVDGDQVLFWDNATQNFKETLQYFDGLGWLPNEPVPGIGESFFVSKTVQGAWVRTFSVN
jgi:hypothetical protein